MNKINVIRACTACIVTLATMAMPVTVLARNGTPNSGNGTTSFSVSNVSGTGATIVAAYYDQTGSNDYTDSGKTLNSLARRDYDLSSDTPLGTSWKGSVVLSSDQDIIAQAITRYQRTALASCGAVADDGIEYSDYEATTSPSTSLYAPALFRTSNNNLASRFTVQNTTATDTKVYINYYNRQGVFRGQQIKDLGAYRSVTVDASDDTQIPNAFVADEDGSLLITSTVGLAGVVDSVQVVVSPCQHYQMAYAMASPSQVATRLYHPSIFRIARPGMSIVGTGLASKTRLGSSMQIQNTSPSATAHVTVTFISRATGTAVLTLTTSIAGNSAIGVNTTLGSSTFPTSTFVPLGNNFSGSAVVESDQPIVGTGIFESPEASSGNEQNYSDQFTLPTATDATNTVFVPRMGHVCSVASCSTATSISQWTEFSAAQIINVGDSPVTLTSIDFFGANGGATLLSFTSGVTMTIQPGASIGVNLRNGGSFTKSSMDALTNNFNGTMRVTAPSGAKLKAVYNSVFGSLGQTIGNAQNR